MNDTLRIQLESLPDNPGVYIMKDASGQVIYVGKAISLKNRVRQYFHASRDQGPKVTAIVARIESLETVLTGGEMEALALECNLIKQHHPRYNILLRDDKHYPYIRIDMTQDYPRIEITRRMDRDRARYFGPYFGARGLRQVLDAVAATFPTRTCRKSIDAASAHDRPCLNYQMGRCPAPCAGLVSPAEYKKTVSQVIRFLEGREDEVIQSLTRQMNEAAEAMEFELAARLRDRRAAAERILSQHQRVISTAREDWNVAGLYRDGVRATVQLMVIRAGRMIGTESFHMAGSGGESDADIVTAFMKQYYPETRVVPGTVIVPALTDDMPVLELWLSSLRGRRVRLIAPQRGEKRRLLEMACRNARQSLEKEAFRQLREDQRTGGALRELAAELDLPAPPARVECFDNSNIQGTDPVASMVVFEDGKPARREYRRFKIKTVAGADDFASMAEVIARRFTRGLTERQQRRERGESEDGGGFSRLPDLLIVDGGQGQLSAARAVMRALGVEHIPTIGLAKREEEIYREGEDEPLRIDRLSPASLFIQHVRDEAHRFAITYHRSLRGQRTLRSQLDAVPGIGPARRRALLRAYPSLTALREASVDELAAVRGMNRPTAEAVKRFFEQKGEG
ncbi:MAG: excinuclease ABC subunit UvrC [Clostridiales bacterium]|nr:excinuclease ABC subunit UvrC [Clostridiales bacterium]